MKKRSNGEGSIRKKQNGRWVATLTLGHDQNGKQKRWSFSGKSQTEVRVALEKAKADQGKGVLVEGASITLAAYFVQYLEYKKGQVRYNSHKSLEYHSRVHILPRLGKLPLGKLTALNVQGFVTALTQAGHSHHVVGGSLRVLKMALRQALRWELLGRNPADNVKPPKVERQEMKVWTQQQALQFLRFAETHRLYAVFFLALVTGMRKGELLGLRWEDIDFSSRTLTIRNNLVCIDNKPTLQAPKTHASRRTIALNDDAIAVLEQHRSNQSLERHHAAEVWTESGMVFTSEIGSILDPSNLSGFFKRLIKASNVPDIRFHDLRHTSASLLFLNGISAKLVSDRLGHSNVGFTLQTYTHLYQEQRREAALPLNVLLGSAAPRTVGVPN